MKIPDFTPEQRKGLIVLAAGALTLTLFFFFSSRTEAVPPLQSSSALTPGDSATPNNPTRLLYIDVAGKVKAPGVYQLPEGSRVIDAIKIAGGLKPGVSTSHINLARKLIDGEQVLITKEKFVAAPSSSGRKMIYTGKVSINTASKAQFDSLPGIGPVIAQRIIDHRSKNGPFATIESIQSVSGIGDAIFRQISDRLTL